MTPVLVNILKKLSIICWQVLNGGKIIYLAPAAREVWHAAIVPAFYKEGQHPCQELIFRNVNVDWEKPSPFT